MEIDVFVDGKGQMANTWSSPGLPDIGELAFCTFLTLCMKLSEEKNDHKVAIYFVLYMYCLIM